MGGCECVGESSLLYRITLGVPPTVPLECVWSIVCTAHTVSSAPSDPYTLTHSRSIGFSPPVARHTMTGQVSKPPGHTRA